MSQSASLYRISQSTFNELSTLGNTSSFTMSMVKSSVLFQGSFMGLEFILSKDKDSVTTNLINQLFNPEQILGDDEYNGSISQNETNFYNSYENGEIMFYGSITTIAKINDVLEKISVEEVSSNYNSDELNRNEIYPKVWHDDNSIDMIFNKRQILEDFAELTLLYRQAAEEQDYILVYIG